MSTEQRPRHGCRPHDEHGQRSRTGSHANTGASVEEITECDRRKRIKLDRSISC